MKRLQKDNKGFSLVELIIVIAILAILVAIIGSQVIPYIEKSRVSKDLSTLDAVQQSLQAIIADYSSKNDSPASFGPVAYGSVNSIFSKDASDWAGKFYELVKLPSAPVDAFNSKAANKSSTKTLNLYYNNNRGEIAVTIGDLAVSSDGGSWSDGKWSWKGNT